MWGIPPFFTFSRLKILGQGLVKLLWKLFYSTLNQFSYPFAYVSLVRKCEEEEEKFGTFCPSEKKKNLKKFDPIRVEARDSISETRNSLMSVTVERLLAVFSTRSLSEMHALPACRQATSATWSRGYLVGTRSNVTFFRTELFAKLRWSNVFDYFFKKLPLCSIGKANNISDMRLYIFIVVDTSQRGARLGHDHPRLSFPLLRRSRFIVSCR